MPVVPPALATLGPGAPVEIKAIKDSRIVLIGGESVGKRYMWWNFVSSTTERIERAKQEWKDKKMGEIPGESEYAELPESDSFSALKD